MYDFSPGLGPRELSRVGDGLLKLFVIPIHIRYIGANSTTEKT